MAPRLQFQSLLETITARVYFQPPINIQLEYPCIIYERSSAQSEHADNKTYRYTKRYKVTAIDRNPDGPLHDQLAVLPLSDFDRFFTADGLNHDVFNIFF